MKISLHFSHIVLELLSVVASLSSEPSTLSLSSPDWTTGCPSACVCKWKSGKRTAECQDKGFTQLPDFKQADKIQVLHLENNQVEVLDDHALKSANLINLQKLYMTNCSLGHVSASAFNGIVLLIEIDLSHNKLKSLEPGTFSDNYRIRKLWLSHNPFRHLDGFSFPSIGHLRMLDLSHCQLRRLGLTTFRHLPDLEVLRLNGNRFRRLDKRLFTPITALKSLVLGGNPWLCDCRLQDFWQWLTEKNLYSHPTACERPRKLSGETWNNLSAADLACPPEIYIPEPMVTMSTAGDVIRLACLVSENPRADVSWVRGGTVIANNSRTRLAESDRSGDNAGKHQYFSIQVGTVIDPDNSYAIDESDDDDEEEEDVNKFRVVTSIIDGSELKHHHKHHHQHQGRHRGGSVKKWFNLTIENVLPSGSGLYKCLARNEGGIAEGNVTVVFSESVATYLDKDELSTLVVLCIAASAIVFTCIGVSIVCFVARQKVRHRYHHRSHQPLGNSFQGRSKKATDTGNEDHAANESNVTMKMTIISNDNALLGPEETENDDDLIVESQMRQESDTGTGNGKCSKGYAPVASQSPERSLRAKLSDASIKFHSPSPAHQSLMDRMWQRDIGSRTELLAQHPHQMQISSGDSTELLHHPLMASSTPPMYRPSPGSRRAMNWTNKNGTFTTCRGNRNDSDNFIGTQLVPTEHLDDDSDLAALAHEVRTRKELLDALVRDKKDTPV